jgi:hypothetical protein
MHTPEKPTHNLFDAGETKPLPEHPSFFFSSFPFLPASKLPATTLPI